jgi:uncharacterized protein
MAYVGRVLIIPGHGNTPRDNWYQWFASELRDRGFDARVPEMPNPNSPKIEEWVERIRTHIPNPDSDTYLVGHSLGAQAILRHLAHLEEGCIGGALFVAGFALADTAGFSLVDIASMTRRNWRAIRFLKLLNNWYKAPILWEDVKAKAQKGFVSIFSSNDPYIPLGVSDIFRERLGSGVVIVPNAGHFRERDGFAELEVALEEFLKMARRAHNPVT